MNNITSKDLFNILVKNVLLIILSAIVFATGAFIYCENFTDERYRAQGEIIVSNGALGSESGNGTSTENGSTDGNTSDSTDSDKVLNTDVAASINLLYTIEDTLAKNGIYKEFATYLKENSNLNYSWSTLKGASSVSHNDRSLYFTISFELNSRDDAIAVTNHFLEFAPEYIKGKIVGCRAEADPDCDSAVQTAPQTLRTSFIAAVAGALLCYVVVFLIAILNSTIKSDEDFSTRYSIPVIGNIPDFSVTHNNSKYASKKTQGGKKNG